MYLQVVVGYDGPKSFKGFVWTRSDDINGSGRGLGLAQVVIDKPDSNQCSKERLKTNDW
jgi:hypothetical protein